MAEMQEFNQSSTNISAGATPVDPKQNGKPVSLKQGKESHIDREERLRLLREKQNEERQRKLDELKQQALAAQKFREQKEEERRRRLEEMRMRDTDRRHQVEERKRQIWEAERDRREAILRKNQEREARIESKRKNERSSIVFAFGSSTPRMLEPGDTGNSYWTTRRATSTTNVMTLSLSAASPGGPLTRRSSERELDGSGSKKRAASAGGIDRKIHHDPLRMTSSSIYEVFQWGGENIQTPPTSHSVLTNPNDSFLNRNDEMDSVPAAGISAIMSRSVARRKTDLTPTVPQSASSREAMCSPTPTSGGSRTPRSTKTHPGLRSGEMTPSRPQSSMSQHSVTSQLSTASASLRSRSATTSRKPRPVSIAVTGITSPADKGLVKSPSVGGVATERPPLPKVHSTKKTGNTASGTGNANATTTKADHHKKPSTDKEKSKISKTNGETSAPSTTSAKTAEDQLSAKEDKQQPPLQDQPNSQHELSSVETTTGSATNVVNDIPKEELLVDLGTTSSASDKPTTVEQNVSDQPQQQQESQVQQQNFEQQQPQPVAQQSENGQSEIPADADMTSSMIAKIRITTEEEAKAALAERRRIAREQAEREAELERQRLEAERLAEEERLRKEEEEQRRMEEEQLRLLEEARIAEELRLKQAIEEAQRREEEERKRKEEELRLKIEKEEAEKKAKEEAEKMRLEMEQRLKKEEEDRQARRKRVEAIMLRTRGKGSMTSNTTPTKDGEESEEISPADEARKMTESVTSITTENEQFLHSERSHTDANGMSGIKTSSSTQQQQQQQESTTTTTTTTTVEQLNNKHNGHHNGSYNTVAQNNVTNSLLVNLGTESVGQILDVPGGKIPQDQPQFIPQFQEKKEPHTVNDLLS